MCVYSETKAKNKNKNKSVSNYNLEKEMKKESLVLGKKNLETKSEKFV